MTSLRKTVYNIIGWLLKLILPVDLLVSVLILQSDEAGFSVLAVILLQFYVVIAIVILLVLRLIFRGGKSENDISEF